MRLYITRTNTPDGIFTVHSISCTCLLCLTQVKSCQNLHSFIIFFFRNKNGDFRSAFRIQGSIKNECNVLLP